jgi:heme-degrading monooxygenase HmoA
LRRLRVRTVAPPELATYSIVIAWPSLTAWASWRTSTKDRLRADPAMISSVLLA